MRGRRVVDVAVTRDRAVRRQPIPDFIVGLRGRTIDAVRRHGKFLIVDLDGDDALVAHLRMSGQLRVAMPDDEKAKHTHVVVDLDDGSQLRFVDPRTFGEMWVGAPPEGLGLDAIDPKLTAKTLHERLTRGRRLSTIKAALLDQSAVAGVGNIYADEALFAAGIHPKRPASSLTLEEATDLRKELRRILTTAIKARGTTFSDYRDAYGAVGGNRPKVYGREGKPCPTCGTPIEKSVIAQRGTHFCPTCQTMRGASKTAR